MRSPRFACAAGATLLSTLVAGTSDAGRKPAVRITALAPLPGATSSEAAAINERGAVAGSSSGVDLMRAVLWPRAGRPPVDLGALPGLTYSVATALNGRGEVVGYCVDETFDRMRGFLYRGGKPEDLGDLGADRVVPAGINDAGQVVGVAGTGDGETHAFVWDRGRMRDLGTAGGTASAATGIRGRSIIAEVRYPDATRRAVVWDAVTGGVRTLEGEDGRYTPLGLNGRGDVVGRRLQGTGQSAVYWPRTGGLFEIGTPASAYSAALGINRRGWIVGLMKRVGGENEAILAAGKPGRTRVVSLNGLLPRRSGWRLSDARGINDSGDVAGNGMLDGAFRGFVLRVDAAHLR